MASLTPGTRLKSTVCTTEIMVITAPAEGIDIMCGGEPMNSDGQGNGGSAHQEHAAGSILGKRYTNEEGGPGSVVRERRRGVAVGRRLSNESEGRNETSQDGLIETPRDRMGVRP